MYGRKDYDFFQYKNKKYPYKSIYLPDDNQFYTISIEELDSVLFPNDVYDSEEARFIDEQIFCFVPEEIFRSSDDVIRKYISENIL